MYELCSKNTQIYYTPKCLISYNYTTAFFSAVFLFISHFSGKRKAVEKRSALSLLLKQVFLQYKISNCQNNHTISQDMCTLFARSLYPTLCSWIIRVDICRPIYPPKDNPWVKLPSIRSKMLLPFGHKQYFEADKQQNSNVSQSYFFSHIWNIRLFPKPCSRRHRW